MPQTRLLLVEDDYDVAELLMTFFAGLEYDLFHAADGKDGIALARARLPNVILLDVMLPDMTGWDVAERLRSTAMTRYIPIIFLTQRNARTDKLKGLGLGADDYITKPFDLEELRLRVRGMVRRAENSHSYDQRTGLPGNAIAQAEVENRANKRDWHYFTIRIEALPAFREAYGFMAGDEVLAYAAATLLDTVREFGTPDDFVGIQDDDCFVILTQTRRVKPFQQALEDRFASKLHTMYNFADYERGYLVLNAGTDEEQHAPLMHLALAKLA